MGKPLQLAPVGALSTDRIVIAGETNRPFGRNFPRSRAGATIASVRILLLCNSAVEAATSQRTLPKKQIDDYYPKVALKQGKVKLGDAEVFPASTFSPTGCTEPFYSLPCARRRFRYIAAPTSWNICEAGMGRNRVMVNFSSETR